MSRETELLSMAADAFADGSNPFATDSLVRHRVTLDECMDLSEKIATIIRGYLAAPRDVQNKVLLASISLATGIRVEDLMNAVDKETVLGKLKALRKP